MFIKLAFQATRLIMIAYLGLAYVIFFSLVGLYSAFLNVQDINRRFPSDLERFPQLFVSSKLVKLQTLFRILGVLHYTGFSFLGISCLVLQKIDSLYQEWNSWDQADYNQLALYIWIYLGFLLVTVDLIDLYMDSRSLLLVIDEEIPENPQEFTDLSRTPLSRATMARVVRTKLGLAHKAQVSLTQAHRATPDNLPSPAKTTGETVHPSQDVGAPCWRGILCMQLIVDKFIRQPRIFVLLLGILASVLEVSDLRTTMLSRRWELIGVVSLLGWGFHLGYYTLQKKDSLDQLCVRSNCSLLFLREPFYGHLVNGHSGAARSSFSFYRLHQEVYNDSRRLDQLRIAEIFMDPCWMGRLVDQLGAYYEKERASQKAAYLVRLDLLNMLKETLQTVTQQTSAKPRKRYLEFGLTRSRSPDVVDGFQGCPPKEGKISFEASVMQLHHQHTGGAPVDLRAPEEESKSDSEATHLPACLHFVDSVPLRDSEIWLCYMSTTLILLAFFVEDYLVLSALLACLYMEAKNWFRTRILRGRMALSTMVNEGLIR